MAKSLLTPASQSDDQDLLNEWQAEVEVRPGTDKRRLEMLELMFLWRRLSWRTLKFDVTWNDVGNFTGTSRLICVMLW
jgi:hypothetical protein